MNVKPTPNFSFSKEPFMKEYSSVIVKRNPITTSTIPKEPSLLSAMANSIHSVNSLESFHTNLVSNGVCHQSSLNTKSLHYMNDSKNTSKNGISCQNKNENENFKKDDSRGTEIDDQFTTDPGSYVPSLFISNHKLNTSERTISNMKDVKKCSKTIKKFR